MTTFDLFVVAICELLKKAAKDYKFLVMSIEERDIDKAFADYAKAIKKSPTL